MKKIVKIGKYFYSVESAKPAVTILDRKGMSPGKPLSLSLSLPLQNQIVTGERRVFADW